MLTYIATHISGHGGQEDSKSSGQGSIPWGCAQADVPE